MSSEHALTINSNTTVPAAAMPLPAFVPFLPSAVPLYRPELPQNYHDASACLETT